MARLFIDIIGITLLLRLTQFAKDNYAIIGFDNKDTSALLNIFIAVVDIIY